MSFDLVVIGGGPGGYVAAIRAAQLGLKTALVERDALGGICLNWGCIPTKSLLKAGELYASLDHLEGFGISVSGRTLDFPRMIRRSREVSAQLNAGIAHLLKKNRVEVIQGSASVRRERNGFTVSTALTKGGTRDVQAQRVILATGARARTMPDLGLVPDGKLVWSYREALVPSELPKSLVIIGSGAIGIEFACFFNALGAKVTVVEVMPRILPVEDEEVSAAAQAAFAKRGIAFRTGARVRKLAIETAGVRLELEGANGVEELRADRAIVAVGITANTEKLGLEAMGVKLEKGHIVTDRVCATNVPGLYAIGDVAGPPWLAHKASHEGIRCVDGIAGLPVNQVTSPIPGCTYSAPQVASVGLTEKQAVAAGHEVKVGRYSFKHHGKAIASGETEGFIKTVYESKTGRLLGAHMLGAEVTEMIQGFVVAMTLEATEAEILATVFPHPTMSEAMHESTLAAFGRALHG